MKINKRLIELGKANEKSSYVNSQLYRMLYSEEFHVMAYESIKTNAGILTPGVTRYTADGLRMEHVRKLITKLKDESYQPSPCRRVYIEKANGKMRPLGLPDFDDKLVQECVRIILECIYDSPNGATFKSESFGYRPGLGCHSALKHVYLNFQHTAWMIQADVKGFFDNVDHKILIKFLRKRIKDERFLNLIRKFLRAGFVENNKFVQTAKGTPQGGIISPILANVYLHEFDEFVGDLRRRHGSKMVVNPEYNRTHVKHSRIKKRLKELSFFDEERSYYEHELKKAWVKRDGLQSRIVEDSNKAVLCYARYADDWILGIKGGKEVTKVIYDECEKFFKDILNLEWNKEKSGFHKATDKRTDFLGVELSFADKRSEKRSYVKRGGKDRKHLTRTIPMGQFRYMVNKEKLLKKLRAERYIRGYDDKPIQNGPLINLQEGDIVKTYKAVFAGMYNYYRMVVNIKDLDHIYYLMKQSLVKTLAAKYKTKTSTIYGKYGKDITIRTGRGKAIDFARPTFSNDRMGFMVKTVKADWLLTRVMNNMRSASWLRAESCCICGSTDRVQMHHVKHIRKTGVNYKGFHKIMGAINRKQIPVCHGCHTKIHDGSYDGVSLKDMANRVASELGIVRRKSKNRESRVQ